MSQQLCFGWTWADIRATAIIGTFAGIALSPLVSYAVSFMHADMSNTHIIALSAGSSILFAPSLFCVSVIGRPSAALFVQVWSGLGLALFTAFPLDSFTSALTCGVIAEIVVAGVTRYRHMNAGMAGLVGVVLGTLALALNLIGHRLIVQPTTFALLSFAVLVAFPGVAWLSFMAARAWQFTRSQLKAS